MIEIVILLTVFGGIGLFFWFFMSLFLKQIGFEELYIRFPHGGGDLPQKWTQLEMCLFKSQGTGSGNFQKGKSFFQMSCDQYAYYFRCAFPGLNGKVVAIPRETVKVEDKELNAFVMTLHLKIIRIPDMDFPIKIDQKSFNKVLMNASL